MRRILLSSSDLKRSLKLSTAQLFIQQIPALRIINISFNLFRNVFFDDTGSVMMKNTQLTNPPIHPSTNPSIHSASIYFKGTFSQSVFYELQEVNPNKFPFIHRTQPENDCISIMSGCSKFSKANKFRVQI